MMNLPNASAQFDRDDALDGAVDKLADAIADASPDQLADLMSQARLFGDPAAIRLYRHPRAVHEEPLARDSVSDQPIRRVCEQVHWRPDTDATGRPCFEPVLLPPVVTLPTEGMHLVDSGEILLGPGRTIKFNRVGFVNVGGADVVLYTLEVE